MRLEPGKVIGARAKEVTYLREQWVYEKTHRHHAMINKWRITQALWIEINRGDDGNPVYRSRLVGQEVIDG